jgi:F1F0 ATPase subunit 2
MNTVALAGVAGVLCGLLFFGGLWWTVRRGLASPVPAVWFLLSALARIGALLLCFQLIARGSLVNLLACVAGFVLARMAITHLVRQGQRHAHQS